MNITISVPLKSEIVFNGIKIALAKNKGDSCQKRTHDELMISLKKY